MISTSGYNKNNQNTITGFWKKQVFIAATGQVDFVVTDFNPGNNFLVFLNDIYQSDNVTHLAGTISFQHALEEGDTVAIYGIESQFAVLNKQVFVATSNQQVFTVTDFSLSPNYLILINDMLQSTSTCAFQTITLNMELPEGTMVTIFDVTRLQLTNKQEFTAIEGQTAFTVTKFWLTDNYMLFVNDIHQGNSERDGQVVTLPFASNEGSKIIIYN